MRFLAILVGLALAGPSAAAEAGPSRYTYEMCDSVLPGGGTPGLRYAQSPGQPWAGVNSCAQPGGALAINLNGATAGGDAEWGLPIEPPAGGRLESVSVAAGACGMAPGLWASVLDRPDWPGQTCAADQRAFALTPQMRGYIVALSCSGVYGSCGGGPWVYAQYFATTVVDPVAPVLGEPEGSLLGGGVLRGHQSLAASADDTGGGIASLSVAVNGLPAAAPHQTSCSIAQARNPSVSGTVAAQISPCPGQAGATWTLDTAAFPFRDGANSVQVCASDFATLSDPNTTCLARTVNVDDSCAESPVPGGEVLSARFARSHDDSVTVGYGDAATVEGKLTDDAGDPVPGASLCVKMQTLGVDDRLASVGVVRTDASGDYSYQVAPGPNREVQIGYRHDTAQVARGVRYYAHARGTLHVDKARLRNGERLLFWGKLPGPHGAGRVVVLQASTVGSKRWITFRKATANGKAVFHAAYRFHSTTRRTRYRFRALVPRQAGYPWVQGKSKAVEVLVRR